MNKVLKTRRGEASGSGAQDYVILTEGGLGSMHSYMPEIIVGIPERGPSATGAVIVDTAIWESVVIASAEPRDGGVQQMDAIREIVADIAFAGLPRERCVLPLCAFHHSSRANEYLHVVMTSAALAQASEDHAVNGEQEKTKGPTEEGVSDE